MEISLISDPISSIVSSGQSLGLSNLLLKRSHNVFSLSDDQSHSQPLFHVSAASRPPTKTLTRPRLRASRRVRRKTSSEDDGDESNYYSNRLFGFTGGDFGSFGDGYFGNGGGGGGGGGGGWNSGGGGYGGSSWEESSDNTVSDPAFDFVYMVLCCIALSNCLLFSLKKAVVRIVGDRGDKVALQLTTTVC